MTGALYLVVALGRSVPTLLTARHPALFAGALWNEKHVNSHLTSLNIDLHEV